MIKNTIPQLNDKGIVCRNMRGEQAKLHIHTHPITSRGCYGEKLFRVLVLFLCDLAHSDAVMRGCVDADGFSSDPDELTMGGYCIQAPQGELVIGPEALD